MAFVLDGTKFPATIAAAAMVITGTVANDTSDASGIAWLKYPGIALFVSGWILAAWAASYKSTGMRADARTVGVWMACLSVVASFAGSRLHPSKFFPVLFAVSWLAFGALVGDEDVAHTVMGLIAACMVLLAVMVVMPWQRSRRLADGPGLPLYVAAWSIVVYVNSIR